MGNKFTLKKDAGYFSDRGVQVMAFSDFYPSGHQSGICVIMHGKRIATNGDVRFEPTPGQWQPVPKKLERTVDEASQTISTTLCYPDKEAHLKGFNPIIYPDFEFTYKVHAAAEADGITITVDLDREIPEKYVGKLCFNLELYPGEMFGHPWLCGGTRGIFPRQANGPVFSVESNYRNAGHFDDTEEWTSPEILAAGNKEYSPIVADDLLAVPYAKGNNITICPDDPEKMLTVSCEAVPISLYDGRMNHNNGWFVLSSPLPAGKTENALTWKLLPHTVEDWLYPPVIQVSQIGYHPAQKKTAVIEMDPADNRPLQASLIRYTEAGPETVKTGNCSFWGDFLRYKYAKFDFSDITEPGCYQVRFGGQNSAVFTIDEGIYDRGVWQPVLEYFLPVQMCHMRVQEKYRVWHGHCHKDDARMAPISRGHFDGYRQGPSTLCKYKSGDVVPGLNVGGWHDAGDFDLRVESQSGECYILALAYEAFGVDYDATTIDQKRHLVEIHQPDGKNDILQQIEHGALSVVGAYNALGRLYRGIICNDLRQYVLQGDAAAMTDGVSGDADDRWVFTEDHPAREFSTAAHLAAVARVLKDFNPTLAEQSLKAAENLFADTRCEDNEYVKKSRIHAAAELLLTTGKELYKEYLLSEKELLLSKIGELGWLAVRVYEYMDEAFKNGVRAALEKESSNIHEQSLETPYGIPYRPHIWGAGWSIQGMCFHYYFLHCAYPDLFDKQILEDSLHFILGCHPGLNTASFASGVGARSMTTAYGMNRADWSYIPGGVVSGTALIQPDFPELLDFPFLWQQAEYVLGGGSSNFMFLVLAVQQLFGR